MALQRFDPEYTRNIFAREPLPEGFGDLDNARQAAITAWEAIGHAQSNAKGNVDLSTVGRKRAALLTAVKLGSVARDTLRETIAKAKRDANDSSERIAAALRPGNDAAAVAINAEIRSVLRTMTDGDRVAAIKGALDGGDLRLARAVLFESPLLCPLPPEVRSHLQDKFFEVGAQNDPAYPKLLALRAGTEALEVTQTQLDAHLATLAADAKSVGIAVTPEQAEALGLRADPRMQRGEA